jgi:hypothetical protein
MLLPTPRPKISQGDIIDDIPVFDHHGKWTIKRQARVVILSHDCEMDKPNDRARYVLVAELRGPGDAGSGNWGNIKAGKGWNTLYVPADPPIGDGYVDFGRVHRVTQTALREAMDEGKRLASMTDDAREAIVYAFASYLLHDDLAAPSS